MSKEKSTQIIESENLALIWKNKPTYEKYDKTRGSLYNSWRARIYNQKGKDVGFPDEWKTFTGFEENIPEGWEKGKILVRLNSELPYTIDNCRWADKGEENINRCIKFSYNGETKFLFEWCNEYNLHYMGVLQRYHRGKNYTPEQVLFGKLIGNKREIKDYRTLKETQQIRDKVSKMKSAYKLKDKKKKRDNDITNEYLRETLNKSCIYCGTNEKIGLDRVDNSIGHLKSNCVPCCYRCNATRGDNFTKEEMLILGKTIKKIDNARNKKKRL